MPAFHHQENSFWNFTRVAAHVSAYAGYDKFGQHPMREHDKVIFFPEL
jgi:hypothetical protein